MRTGAETKDHVDTRGVDVSTDDPLFRPVERAVSSGRGWQLAGEGVAMSLLTLSVALSWVLVLNTYVIGAAIARWIGGGP